jgi:hypothetical protein
LRDYDITTALLPANVNLLVRTPLIFSVCAQIQKKTQIKVKPNTELVKIAYEWKENSEYFKDHGWWTEIAVFCLTNLYVNILTFFFKKGLI